MLINKDLVNLAHLAWEQAIEEVGNKKYALAHDEFEGFVVGKVRGILSVDFPKDMKNIRVVVYTKCLDNYEIEWKMKLEYVETVEVV